MAALDKYRQFAGTFVVGRRMLSYNFFAILARREEEIKEWLDFHSCPIATKDPTSDKETKRSEMEETKRNDISNSQLKAELGKIKEAKKKWEKGVYGICLISDGGCGADISEGRLVPVPHATRCSECQEKWDKTHPKKYYR